MLRAKPGHRSGKYYLPVPNFPALFETSQNEQHILHLPANAPLVEGQSYTVGLEQADGTVPAFMVWAAPVHITVGTEATAPANIAPKTINRIADKDADGNLIKQLTITDSSAHFTGDGNRYLRILKVASDGTETQVYPRTLIQNGTDGTIITENYTEGSTTVQVSHDFTDENKYPNGTYKVELYLTDTATKPVATGNMVVMKRPFNLVFFKTDHLGTPRVITDQDGKVLSTHDYLAYGEELTDPEFSTNRMKFTGHERDPETGLDYMLARYYTSGSGRFLQVDPGYDYDQTDPMSFNLYGYVHAHPTLAVDVSGEEEVRVIISADMVKDPKLRKRVIGLAHDFVKKVAEVIAKKTKRKPEDVSVSFNASPEDPNSKSIREALEDKETKAFLFIGHGGNYSSSEFSLGVTVSQSDGNVTETVKEFAQIDTKTDSAQYIAPFGSTGGSGPVNLHPDTSIFFGCYFTQKQLEAAFGGNVVSLGEDNKVNALDKKMLEKLDNLINDSNLFSVS